MAHLPFQYLHPHAWFVLVILFLELLNLGMLGPSLPDLKYEFFGSYSKAAWVSGVFDSCGAFLAFLCAPVIGAASDKYGRRYPLIASVVFANLPVWALASGLRSVCIVRC